MDSKKFLLLMAACFLIIVVWTKLGDQIFGPLEPKQSAQPPTQPEQEPQDDGEQAGGGGGESAGKLEGADQGDATVPAIIVQKEGLQAVSVQKYQPREGIMLGSRQRGSGYKLELSLTADGAAIAQAWLTEFADGSQEYKFSQGPYGEGRRTPLALLNPVAGRYKKEGDKQDLAPCRLSLATSRLKFLRPKSQQSQPGQRLLATFDLIRAADDSGDVVWRLLERHNYRAEQKSWAKFEAKLQLKQLEGSESRILGEVTLVKTYTLSRDSYDVEVKLEIQKSLGSGDFDLELVQDGPTGLGREDLRGGDLRAGVYGSVQSAKGGQRVEVKAIGYKKAEQEEGGLALSKPEEGELLWAGVMNKFFGAFLVPDSKFGLAEGSPDPEPGNPFSQVQIIPIVDPDEDQSGNVLSRLLAPSLELAPGQKKAWGLKLFLGPKERALLKSGRYGELNFGKTIQYPWCAIESVSRTLLWLLGMIYAVIPNYGLGIILLVALVRLALHHFTRMSQVSMMRMSKLGPEMEKIKQKYPNNREEQSRAQMTLYKEHKINPVSGCLPMLLQMPIWIALYSGLNIAVELRHARFFWWISNLSGPDNITAYFAGGLPQEPWVKLPLLGAIWGLNILPILLGIAFFLQQKFTPSSGAGASAQAAQTKKMMSFMMLLFPLMLYGAPSGLNLYIMTSVFVGIVENHYIKKHIRQKEEAQNQPAGGKDGGKMRSFRLKK